MKKTSDAADERRRAFLTVLYGFLLILLYVVIFVLSSQDGETSGNLSMKISEKCTELFGSVSGRNWTGSLSKEMAEYFEHPLRKLAHFSEYACMGALVYLLWELWLEREQRIWKLAGAWVFLSACLDELHQFYVPGRFSNFYDVCLDMSGGVCGILLILWRRKRSRNGNGRRKNESETVV